MTPRKRKYTPPPPPPAPLPRPDHEGLTEDELEKVRNALFLDANAGLPDVLAVITSLDNDRRTLGDVRDFLDVGKDDDDNKIITTIEALKDELDVLKCETDTLGGDLNELADDLHELVSLLMPRLGGFRDGEPREVFDLRVLVDRLAHRMGQ